MKDFYLEERYALINFDAFSCNNSAEVLDSKSFSLVLRSFIKHLKVKNHILIDQLIGLTYKDILSLYKFLLIFDLDSALSFNESIKKKHLKSLYVFTEELYNYWRNLARFGILKASKNYNHNLKVNDLILTNDNFNNTIINLYRTISQKIGNIDFHVFRQLPAGINANMLYVLHSFTTNKDYAKLTNIPFITKVVTSPPFIINSKSNTRTGAYAEIDHNPLNDLNFNKNDFLAFPIYVGPLLAFVYIHRDFLHHGIALTNLFEFASYETFKSLKPDLIYVYGISETEYDLKYYIDNATNTYIGFVTKDDKNDYFGYLKKMLLTLHNVYMINNNNLPIHGAMVKLILKNGLEKTICIIGDSGAGKSESLEALRLVGSDYIKQMDIIFDDMGTFKIIDNKVYANGTETGAFVRLDDLDTGYAYEIMDRALFLNPNKVNARVLIPISSYELILENHPVDLLLYANNYDENNQGIKIIDNLDDSSNIFKEGIRFAKGTTSEKGLVNTFFANPFGPMQLKDKTNKLIDKFFENLSNNNTKIGVIYTKLGISGFETSGPNEAALSLLKLLIKEDN